MRDVPTAENNTPGCRSTIVELPLNERSFNVVQSTVQTNSLSRLREKVEQQLGGSLLDPDTEANFSLLIFRKINALTQEVRELKDLLRARVAPQPNERKFALIPIMQTEHAYHQFVSSLSDLAFKNDVVSHSSF